MREPLVLTRPWSGAQWFGRRFYWKSWDSFSFKPQIHAYRQPCLWLIIPTPANKDQDSSMLGTLGYMTKHNPLTSESSWKGIEREFFFQLSIYSNDWGFLKTPNARSGQVMRTAENHNCVAVTSPYPVVSQWFMRWIIKLQLGENLTAPVIEEVRQDDLMNPCLNHPWTMK